MQKMQSKLDLYRQMKTLMSDSNPLSQIEQAIILAHATNVNFGMQCLNRSDEKIQYPENWKKHQFGVYKFQYLFNNQHILFRFVNNDNRTLSINFVVEDSQELHQAQIEFSEGEIQNLIKKYEKQLEKVKPQKEEKKTSSLLIREIHPYHQPYDHPRRDRPPQVFPNNGNNPFNMPFSGNEYVGPDNQIFRGRQENNPFSLQGMRKPPGARYDPTNPFNIDEGNQRIHDFQGFNQFGMPRGGNRTNFNPFG